MFSITTRSRWAGESAWGNIGGDLIKTVDAWREKAAVLTEVKGVGPETARTCLAHLPELGTLNKSESGAMRGKKAIHGGREVKTGVARF